MNHTEFWNFFDSFAYPQLAHRAETFKLAFQHLTNLQRPVCIVETGCVRNQGTYAGEGQSTVLFDKFSECVPGTLVHTVDINPESTDMCKSLVSSRVQVHTMDSVQFLKNKCRPLIAPYQHIDLLYLDSYDVDFDNPHDSAMHHMKELLAASPLISQNTLILLDDSPSYATFFFDRGQMKLASTQKVGGKGKYIASYMNDIGATPIAQSYQTAWLGL
jgi:hypothetical protein